jgi:hypothetical protein
MPNEMIAGDGPLNAEDLLQLGYVDDPLLLEDVSLCTLCSVTCKNTAVPVKEE